VPRGPADRPIRVSDPEAALQAAMAQARERGAAVGVPARAPDADPPAFGGRIAEPAPVRAVRSVARHRGVRSVAPSRPRKPDRREHERVPDPGGRGSALDVRV